MRHFYSRHQAAGHMRTLQTGLDCLFLTLQLKSHQCDGDTATNSCQGESALSIFAERGHASQCTGCLLSVHKKPQVVARQTPLEGPSQGFTEAKASCPQVWYLEPSESNHFCPWSLKMTWKRCPKCYPP